MRSAFGVLTLAVLAACTTTEASEPSPFVDGFNPPETQGDELRVIAPDVAVPASADLSWCTYVPNPFGREVDVVASRGFQSRSGHHAILMEVVGAEDRLGQSHECTDSDMTNARFLAGGSDGAAKFQIPEGVGFRIGTAAVLMIQSHWINTSAKPVTGQTVFNVGVKEPDPARQSAQLFATYTAKVSLPPRGPAHAEATCTIKSDLKFFAIGGHAHEFGTHVSLTVDRVAITTVETLWATDWQPHFQADPPLSYFGIDKPLELHAGDVLHVSCDYENTSDAEVRFPREMCVGMGFYFPGTADIQCGDGHWSTGNGGAAQ